jgi:uncharacterized damage-inducible protein DinB
MDAAADFLNVSRAYLTHEYRIKLRRAVEAIPEHLIWSRPNDESNSVGNLLLHLEGNVRQWIVSGVKGEPDVRQRAGEFAAKEGSSAAELLARLERTLDEADAVLAGLRPEQLDEPRTIQARDVTVLGAIYQTVQHFALHLGQIILIAKTLSPGTIQFYEDAGGRARPIWKEQGVAR